MPTKTRRTGIELLRIIAIIFIIAHHLRYNFHFNDLNNPDYIYIIEILGNLGKVGVGIFFVISGFFMAKSKDLSPRKILPYARTTWFYSYTIFLLIMLANLHGASISLSADNILMSIFPIITDAYWFVTAFIIMRLLYPLHAPKLR